MKLDWIDFSCLFTLIQLLFLTVVILNYKKGKRASNFLLAGFMASNALLIAYILAARFNWISSESGVILNSVGGSAYLLLMPFLYLYIQSLCYNNFRLTGKHLFHALPFVLFVTIGLFQSYFNHLELSTELFRTIRQHIGAAEHWSHQIVLHLQVISYLIASEAVLVGYRTRLRDLYSSIERIDLAWCNLLLIAFAMMWFMDFLNWSLGVLHLSTPVAGYGLFLTSVLINMVFTLSVTYKGLTQSASFSGIQGLPKYASSRLKPSECDAIIRKLTAYIEKEKPFLSPSLSIEELSSTLNVSAKSLSQAIHTGLHQNFYDFINARRIDEVKKRIEDERNKNFTLLALALDSGFNSKSVFNSAFKKHTGITPKEFRTRQAT